MVTRTEGRSTRPALKLTPSKTLSRVTLRSAKPEPMKASKPRPCTVTVRSKVPATVKLRGPPLPQAKGSLRTRRVLTPIPAFNTPTRGKNATYNADASNEESENLEAKIRSALSTPKTAYQGVDAPTSIKSVRWDPAIVSCGPITPVSSSRSDRGNSEPAQSPREPASSIPKRGDIPQEIIIETLSRLKKSDQDTLRRLLDELKDVKSEDETPARSSIQHDECQSELQSNTTLLNPEAPAFRKYATQRAQMAQRKAYVNLGKATLTIPRKRPHFRGGEAPARDSQEPTWVNIFNPPQAMSHGDPGTLGAASIDVQQYLSRPLVHAPFGSWNGPPVYHQMATPNSVPHIPSTSPNNLMEPLQPIWLPMPVPPPYGLNDFSQFGVWVNPFSLQTPQSNQPVQPTQATQSIRPTTFRAPRRPYRPRSGKGPMVDVGPEFIPPEDGPGREARVMETGWATSLLAKFRENYPQTGRVKAGSPAPTQMRHAAAIQQRLEFILYQENERRVREGSSGDEQPVRGELPVNTQRTRAGRSSEEQPPSYRRYETASGTKIVFSEDERVTSGEDVSTDEIVTDQRQAFAHLREKSASLGEVSPSEDQIQQI